ncbi:MAG: bifunctional phosphopantothenoylcysteine decarboxylase/phosphopantothenate--cysteine ligase CoaBC [Solobacterium sp.]|nr:bifunctional phosphopantothenoylcysteine decarboxylase/phosphopantothenate--cysteine ligase CoaBC [Solobacterium sp.]
MAGSNKKNILVGVSGGIAAYKICTLVSSLKKDGHDVHVLMTKEAEEFVGPLTFQTLSGHPVIRNMFSLQDGAEVHHIALAAKADAFVIAPASANTIAKIAHGIADDMLTTTFLAATCPKLIVPAMNTHMLENPVTQDNIALCRKYGMYVMESASGYLACGDTGSGRMPEAHQIKDALESILESERYLAGKKVVVSAGPTQEAVDPVRYITNHSSGKMGYALARAARNAGAHVVLVSGKTALEAPFGIDMIHITSAQDMADAVLRESADADAVIMAAAVADYTPKETADHKLKKSDNDMYIELKRTTDILKMLGERKQPHQKLIGFAMETEDLLANAAGKLEKKNADFIVANSIAEAGAGFGVDTNRVTILSREEEKDLGLLSKDETAEKILEYCLKEG